MNKDEILALGVPADRIRDFQTFYQRDVNKVAARMKDSPDPARAAIAAMLPMIHRPENLLQLLSSINFMYWVENQPPRQKETAQGATNTPDGETEQKSSKLNYSAPIVGANRGESQDEN